MQKDPHLTEVIWQGVPVSGGIAHAVAHVLKDHFDEPEISHIDRSEADEEMARLRAALEATRLEIESLQLMVSRSEGSVEADIFETHLLILEDASMLAQVEKRVRKDLVCVDAAYYHLMLKHMDALRGLADAYLRERFLDIKDVTQRVMRHLRGELLDEPMFDHPVILIAHDLTPSDTVQMDRTKVLGFAVESGSTTSHTAIIARSLALPAVVRLHGIGEELHSGDPVLLDGDEGKLILRPSEETLARYAVREQAAEQREDALHVLRHEPANTLDGRVVRVGVNAEFLEEIPVIQDSGAEEVGLFRTEFLHLASPGASEDWLADAYSQVVRALSPSLVTFRTLDLGGDKVDEVGMQNPEPNPFLGWRGIRLSLGHKDLFKRQLRALLRASAHGRVGIMFPMVSGVDEVTEARQVLEECAVALRSEGVPIGAPEIGAMVEVPSAALCAHQIAKDVNFLSLGTNDLTQYTLAVDRLNDRVAGLYQPAHPAVVRLIQLTVNAGRDAGIRVGICGEMASDVSLTPLLIGLGLEEFSVAAAVVPRLKHAVRRLDSSVCAALVAEVEKESSPARIANLSRAVAVKCYPDLFGADVFSRAG